VRWGALEGVLAGVQGTAADSSPSTLGASAGQLWCLLQASPVILSPGRLDFIAIGVLLGAPSAGRTASESKC
jgi:hypothetical protein